MWKKDKVKKMQFNGNSKANASYTAGEKNNDDQEYYEGKVKGLMECCRNFEKSLKGIKAVNEFTADSIEWRFNYHFGKTMKKMFSKTSRVLKDMDKKLKKLKKKPLAVLDKDNVYIKDDNLVKAIKESFKYNGPKSGWDKDTIDRAAIYDKTVYDFFNGESPQKSLHVLIDDLAGRAVEIKRKESQKNITVWAGKKMGLIEKRVKDIKDKYEELKKEYEELLKKYNALLKQDANQELEKATKELNEVKNKFEDLQKEFNIKLNAAIEEEKSKLGNVGMSDQKAQSLVLNALGVGNNDLPRFGIKRRVLKGLRFDQITGDAVEGIENIDLNLKKNQLVIGNGNALNEEERYQTVDDLMSEFENDLKKFISDYKTIPDKMENKDEKTIEGKFKEANTVIDNFWDSINKIKEEIGKIKNNKVENETEERCEVVKKITNELSERIGKLEELKKKTENLTQKMFVQNQKEVAEIVTEYEYACRAVDKELKKETSRIKNANLKTEDGKVVNKVALNLINTKVGAAKKCLESAFKEETVNSLSTITENIDNLVNEINVLNTTIGNAKKDKEGREQKNKELNNAVRNAEGDEKAKAEEARRVELKRQQDLDDEAAKAAANLKTKNTTKTKLVLNREKIRANIISALGGLRKKEVADLENLNIVKNNDDAKRALNAIVEELKKVLDDPKFKLGVDNVKEVSETLTKELNNLDSALKAAANATDELLKKMKEEEDKSKGNMDKYNDAVNKFKEAGKKFIECSKSKKKENYDKALKDYKAAREGLLEIDIFKDNGVIKVKRDVKFVNGVPVLEGLPPLPEKQN